METINNTICELCKTEPKIVVKDKYSNSGFRIKKLCYKCYYAKHAKSWVANNPDKMKLKYKQNWLNFKNNKELGLQDNLRNVLGQINAKAKRHGSKGTVKIADFREFLKQQTFCQDCGSTENLNVGHMIPLFYPISTQDISNLIRQCYKCNREQGTKVHIKIATDELRKWYPIYVPANHSTKE